MNFKTTKLFSLLFLFAVSSHSASENVLEMLPALTLKAEGITGLNNKGKWKAEVLSREEMGEKIRNQLKRFQSSETILRDELILKKFGLLPKESNYAEMMNNLLKEQVAGLYDPWKKKLYILEDFPPEFQRPALFHEIVHALQDQSLRLKKTLDANLPSDVLRARQAMIEGQAMWAMTELMTQEMFGTSFSNETKTGDRSSPNQELMKSIMLASTRNQPVLAHAPAFIREGLLFPYLDGLWWVQTQVSEGVLFSDMLQEYPQSTEQIIHPLPAEPDIPQKIKLTRDLRSLPKEWKFLHEDVLGEFFWRVWAEELSVSSPTIAAAGWDGDRLLAYNNGDRVLLISLSTWDTLKDARQFARAWIQTLRKRFSNIKRLSPPQTNLENAKAFAWETPEGEILILLREKDVLVIDGAEQTWAEPLLQEVLEKSGMP